MARAFKTLISIEDLAAASSEALRTKVCGDSNARITVDAGGKLTWGSGSATGDTTLYRSAANTLKTDDAFQATLGVINLTSSGAPSASSADGTLAIDTSNHKFYFRSGSSWRSISTQGNIDGGVASTTAAHYAFGVDGGDAT